MKKRSIAELVTGRKAIDGAGVHLVRVLGSPTVRNFDPFLMLDAFDSENPDDYTKGFPTHPHRGIETFTYLMRGRIDHEDSLGNAGSIVDGGCQWMTAGSGILHQEMPQPSRHMLGLQLWVNLPRDRKMVDPAYRDVTADMVPAVEEGGARVAIVAGEYKGVAGATHGDHVDVTGTLRGVATVHTDRAKVTGTPLFECPASDQNPFGNGKAGEPVPPRNAVHVDGRTLCSDTPVTSNQDDWNGKVPTKLEQLAQTGAPIAGVVLVVVALAGGAAVMLVTRRRHAAHAAASMAAGSEDSAE